MNSTTPQQTESLQQIRNELYNKFTTVEGLWHNRRGVDPYGTGGTRPPQYLDWGDMITNAPPPNISRVISATFYPCNIFLMISWKFLVFLVFSRLVQGVVGTL